MYLFVSTIVPYATMNTLGIAIIYSISVSKVHYVFVQCVLCYSTFSVCTYLS